MNSFDFYYFFRQFWQHLTLFTFQFIVNFKLEFNFNITFIII
jgi:hypothetical protein